MKRKYFVWMISALLLLLGMAACATGGDEGVGQNQNRGQNQKGKQNQTGGTIGNREGSKGEAETSEDISQQYIYSREVIDFAEYGSGVVIHDLVCADDRIFVLMEVREWGAEPEDNSQKQESTSYYRVFSCMSDGSAKTVSKEIDLPESGGYISELQLSGNGCVAGLFYSEADDSVSLLLWDAFQDVRWEKTAASGGELFAGTDQFVLFTKSGKDRMIHFYNGQGELTESVKAEGEGFDNFEYCFFTQENKFLVIRTDREGSACAEIYTGDGRLESHRKLPDCVPMGQKRIFPAGNEAILWCDSTGVYRLDLGENTPAEIFSFVDADLDTDGFQLVQQIDEVSIAGIFDTGGTVKLGLFARTQGVEGTLRQSVVLGTMGELDADLRSQIIYFNRQNTGYRIMVKQYITYDEEQNALVQLNADILSGNMPDILLMDQELPLQSYIAKGLLADVGKLLEEDKELDSGQFVTNVMDAFRVNGTLYYATPAFCVDTLVAKQSKVGKRTGWNTAEFLAVRAALPQGMEVLSETSKEDYLRDYMRVCGREYVDMNAGKANFQSEDFAEALRFAAGLPDYAERFDSGENSYDSRYIEDRALLQPVTIRRISDLAQQINGCIGEEISYVGYPTESREGSCIRVYGNAFVLSGQSDRLDGAWEFVRYFLTADYQRKEMYTGGLPIRKDIFEEKAKEAAGYEGYCFVNDEWIALASMTQPQIDRVVDFIMGVRNPAFEDEVIIGIILEEAESFFQGQKSAETAAGMIQNRVQLYLDEK